VQSTTWRNTAVLDFVNHILRDESTLTAAEKSSVRAALKLDGTNLLTKNKVDIMCTALKASSLWSDSHRNLAEEAIEWLKEKQTELDKECEEGEISSHPFTLDFPACSTPSGRGQLALRVQEYKIKDIFTESRTVQHMRSVVKFARLAAEHAGQGLDYATLLEGEPGEKGNSISEDATSDMDAFFVQFMVTIIDHDSQ
jgi:hypothetical protein